MQTTTEPPQPLRMLDLSAVEKKVALRKTSIYKAIEKASFPRPRKLMGASRWAEHEIDAWICDQARGA